MNLKILFLVFIILYYIYIIYKFNNRYDISGIDKTFLLNEEKKNYYITKFKIVKKYDLLYEYIISKFKEYIDDPKSNLRINLINNNISYSKEKTDKIISYTFQKINNNFNLSNEEIINDTIKNKNKIKFYISDQIIITCCSHLFYDGWNFIFNNLKVFLDNKKININLKKYKYFPIYNELMVAKSLPKLLKLYKQKINLNLDYDFKETDKYFYEKYILNNKIIKKLKNANNVNFNVVLASIIVNSIFYSTNVNSLNIGYIYALSNCNKFNNFSVLCINVNRISKNNFNDELNEYIKVINNKFKKAINLSKSIYSINNIYNNEFVVNNRFDVLISALPVSKDKNESINNIEVSEIDIIFPYCSSPIYIICLSNNNKNHIYNHIRTNDINMNKLKEYNNIFK